MSNVIPLNNASPREDASPFDALRHTDEHGEYWLARELMAPLGYGQWRRFADAVERAAVALRTNGEDPNVHIALLPGSAKRPGLPGAADYRLTREGVYATIQGADPRKPEIAAGWAYFRARTRQAETGAGTRLDPDLQRIFDLTVGMQQTRNEVQAIARHQIAMAGQLAGLTGTVADVAARVHAVEGHTGWWTALGYARRYGLRTDHPYLVRLGTRASAVGRYAGVEPVKMDNAVFGSVNQFPGWVRNQAVRETA